MPWQRSSSGMWRLAGKLPTTFPVRYQDNPAYINYPGENGKVYYGEGLYVGYRYYDKKEVAPLFPFGHGLSYTTFTYENVRLNGSSFGPDEAIVVSVDVSNSGDRDGKEIVQVYLRDVTCRLERPLQELKAFAKVALAAGETKTVDLTLGRQSLAFYDPIAGDWVAEAGEFEVLIGASSRDIRGRAAFTWRGDDASGGGLHIGMSLGALLATDKGTAVLKEQLGTEVLENPQINMAMSMTLEQIAPFAGELLSPDKLDAIDAALKG